MNDSSQIDRFIRATRLNVESRVCAPLYRETIFRLRHMAEQFGLPMDVKIVYSSARKVEHITLSGSVWLIYDQYLGQTMNLLNRLFIEAENVRPALVYFHKVLAECLFDVGRLNEAVHCASVYHASRNVLSGIGLNEDWRNLLTRTHENFLMYHEFGHRVFAKAALLPVMREHVRFLIEHEVIEKQRSLEDVLVAVRNAPAPAIHYQSVDDAIQDIKEQHESAEGRQYVHSQLASLAESQTEEEVFCDIFAADFVSNEAKLDNRDHTQVLRAIYVGFYHLQALEYVRRFPSLPSGPIDWLTDNTPRVQVRSHCLRAHLIFLHQMDLQTRLKLEEDRMSEELRAFEIQLMEDQKRYYDVIYDGAIKLCGSLRRDEWITALGKEAIKSLREDDGLPGSTNSLAPSDDELRTVILLMSGWLP